MKKFFALFALILIAVMPVCLVGCKSKYDNLSIEMESSYEIVLGESENDSITIEAKVTGNSDENGGRLSFSPDNDKLVKISQDYKNGINYITLKALAPGKVNIEARTLEGGVTKNFVVNIIQPIKNFSVKSGQFTVVRGGEWKIDVEKHLNLEPTNTTQTDFVVSFAANQDIEGIQIEDNVLKVSKDSNQDEIVLNVQSSANSDIAPKEIKLVVLNEFVEIDKQTQSTQSKFDDGDILVFEKNESMLTYDKLEELNIISNLISESEKEIVVRVYSSREVDVNHQSNSRLSIKKLSSIKTYQANGQVEYTDFFFSVRFADTVSSGAKTSLSFVVSYVGFDLNKQLLPISVAYELAPKTILVNDQDDLNEFTLYNFYSMAKKGQKLQFGVLPTSVSPNNSKMMLLNKDNLVDAFEYLQFFRNNGEELFEGDEINVNEVIYARARSGVKTGSFEVLLQTKFVDPQTNASLSKVLKFNVLSGITEMRFVDDEQINLQLNSTQNSAEILLDVSPANIDITKIHVEEIDGLSFSTMTTKSQTEEGLTLRFVAYAQKVGNYKIKVYSENGIEITKQIKVINALENVVLSAPSPNENSVVGDRQIVDGELRSVAVSLGGAIALEENISPSDANYRVEFSYFETESFPEFALSSYDYPNLVTSTSVGVLDYSQLLGYKKIVALKVGYSVVRAKYIPVGIVNNEETELEPIYKYFVVQGYKPIRSVVMSSNYATLYSLKSVGIFNKDLTMTKVQLSVFPIDATYANSIVWDYDKSGEYFQFDEENLIVYATKRYAGTISILATIKELNRTYTQTLSITILDAKTVSDISVNGIGDSIYIENTDDTTKTFVINAVAFPNDAYNTKLKYDFIDKAGNIIGDIKISADGVMTIPAGVGLSGYVRIAAEDCFQENSLTGEYQPVGIEGKNIILIPTTIANGTSKDTAIRINSKEELQNIDTKKHYKIYCDLDVSGISFDNFSGGLYGYNSQNRVVLSGFDRTFIQTLSKTGMLEDLEIDCDIEMFGENGVLVGKNEGHINNVVAKGNWKGALSIVATNFGKIYNVTSEVIFDGEKFAGIALSNSGEIYNCFFMGSITASNQAAGITLSNAGTLEVCATLLVGENSIKLASVFDAGARLAGVCVENLEGGKILRSYIHSYKSNSSFADSDFAFVGGFVHTNSGSIQKSFSALHSTDLVTGFVYINNSSAGIENCFSDTTFANFNYGTIKKCFCVLDDERLNSAISCYSGTAATEKTVADWLKTDWDISCTYEKATIWKIYLDSQNPYLREISAEVKPESMNISIKEPKNSNSYLKLNENQVLLYRYESQVSPMTSAEKAKLNQYNSISIYDLLTFEILPYNASSSPDMFYYSLSEGSALSMSGLNINVLGLGKQTLTITSKLNPELTFSLDIFTSYPIRDFNIFASSSSLDPTGALTDGSIIYLKRTYTQALYSKVSSSIILVDREISFKMLDLKIDYASEIDAKELGLYLLRFDEKQTIDNFVCSLDFSGITLYEQFEEIKPMLPNYFSRTFKVVVYNGAENMSVSQYSFEMEPIDTIELGVQLKTDVSDEVLNEKYNNKAIKYEIYNMSGVNLTDDYFLIEYSNASEPIIEKNAAGEPTGFRTFDIKLTISLKNRTTQISGDYYIRIYANEEEFTTFAIAPIDVSIKLLPQSLQRIDYSHYYGESTVKGDKEVLVANTSPSNALAPGQVGLLEVNLFPTYSEISHVEIESIPNQNSTVKLQLYQRSGTGLAEFTMVQQNSDYNRTENGIVVGYTMISNGTIYVKTQVASDIPEELTFELVVRAYKTKDDPNPIEQHVFLAAKFIPSARVEVEGQKDYIVMGRGTSKDMTITVVGEGDVEIYANDEADKQKNIYERAYVGQKTLIETKNLGTQNQYVYSCPIFVGSKFTNDKNDVVRIEVVVSREVNGVREKKTTILVVRVLDFVVNKVVLTNGTDKYSSKVSVKTKFDFSYDISQPQAFTNDDDDIKAVDDLNNKINAFKKYQYFTTFGDKGSAYTYEKSFMYVDENGDHSFAIYNDDGYAFAQNEYIKFEDNFDSNKNYLFTTATGLKTGIQKIKLKVSSSSTTNSTEIYSITYEFDVVVTNYSNEDKPMPIGSLEDFNAIFEQNDAQDYILTSDIEIGDHVLYSDTSKIRSLDGNNHKIIITSLNLGENQTLDVALFNTISEITTIKNLIVDYQIGEINVNSDQFSSISVAGLALNNDGIVTNTHVLSSQTHPTQTTGGIQISSSLSQSAQIQMAGFVLNNSGSITNSRVGDTSVSIVDTNGSKSEKPLKVFALVGQDQMAGFVLNNSGIISASYAKNITIINNSKFQSNNQTAGFVLNNQAGAKITGCYVRGVEGLDQSDVYVQGMGIESSFEVAGFVYDNLSYISDCYSNIKLYKELPSENRKGVRSAGFVYRNELGAQIVSSLALSKIVEDDTSQEYFCGVDGENQSNNFGTIIYSYYYSKFDKLQSVADGAEMLNATAVKQQDSYYAFSFTTPGALDGMWMMTSRGPELVSANNIALSKRYLVSVEEDKYDVAYVPNYEYGSIQNPILIRSATEFNEVFGTSKDDSIKKYFDQTPKQAFGNYRLINDIDLADLSLGGNETTTLSSTGYSLMRKTDAFGSVVGSGVLEGNAMTISNLDFSITDTDQTYFGLFASIKNGAVVKNLNLTVKEISASSVNYVGALAGYVENSKIINVSADIAQNQQIALVQGRNIVGGVVGAVAGTSELNNLSSSISAHSTYVDGKQINEVNRNGENFVQVAVPNLPAEGTGLNATVSIAGGVAGAVFAKDINDSSNNNLATIDNAQVKKIKASGKFTISAKIAGGLIGYVGKTTYLHDAWLAISEGQNINAYENGVAGGAVGLSYGKLSHIRIEHNDIQDYSSSAENVQKEIEANVKDYYTNKSNERKTYENMFTSTNQGQTIGGIVGIMNGGVLEDSYTKLDVISDSAYNLGGVVGIVKNQKYEISRVYSFSNVQSKSTKRNIMVGGLFGALLSSGELDTVVGANYLDKNYTTNEAAKQKYVTFEPFAGACTYVPKMSNVYTLSSIWDSIALENKGAEITSSKTVSTLQTNLGNLFPASEHSLNVNEVFEIEDSHFKNAFWARNVDDVLPHLTFGLEEQYYVIDSINTAGDIRKMLKNSNKTFYIDGIVNMNTAEVIRAVNEVRESIVFTGKLLGMPSSMNPSSTDTPTLFGMQELFNNAVGATFADFVIKDPQSTSSTLPSLNYGSLVGKAKDCSFINIEISGSESSSKNQISAKFNDSTTGERNTGALVGICEGKTYFEQISVKNIEIMAGNETNIGLVVGKVTSTYGFTTFRNCGISNCSITASGANENVGGVVGYADGVSITNNAESTAYEGIIIKVGATNVGGLVGNCSGEAIINTPVSNINIDVSHSKDSDCCVGGLVGKAGSMTLTMNAEINLEQDKTQFGKIQLSTETSKNVCFGGIVGKVSQSLSINAVSQTNFKTNDLKVSASNASSVYAGGVAGQTETTSIGGQAGLNVNTQGTIKNRVMSITCIKNIYAGGLVGATENAQIANCWSGTDVEIDGVTATSQVSFGGIVGCAGSKSTEGKDVSIKNNISYGRFYLAPNANVKTINAGGIVGEATAKDGNIMAVANNKTLTSLEISRHATNHNVNAVVGNRSSNIGGTGNAYTYQLSLAVESDTNFATNCNTLSGVGVQISGDEGSILNPYDVVNGHSLDMEGYYKIEEKSTDEKTLNILSANNFVLIGNGKTIKLTDSHIDTIGSRTIISGIVVEGKFDYDVSAGNGATVTINGTKYTYSSSGLTKDGETEEIKFVETTVLGEWQDIEITQVIKYYYKDGDNKVYLTSAFDKTITIDEAQYYVVIINNSDFAVNSDKNKIWHLSSSTQYLVGDKSVNEDDFVLVAYDDNDKLCEVVVKESGFFIGEKKIEEDSAMSGLKIDENLYVIESDEDGRYVTIDANKTYISEENTTYSIVDEKELFNETINTKTLDGKEITILADSVTIGDKTYDKVQIGGRDYVINSDKTQVASILKAKTITIDGIVYTYQNGALINANEKYYILNIGTYEQANGFVSTNNGYLSGVVVKSNYSSSDFGGFVSTNNGTILYSSMNGQVYATSGDVAGFVLENNGIIDYCHSTGAVQGSATNSYSFGKNNSSGALTNSYTIMLNETDNNSENKFVFGTTAGGKFANNEYDPIATEFKQTLTGLSNSLIPNFDKISKSTNGDFWSAKGLDAKGLDANGIDENLANYGYKTLSNGAFKDVSHLSINTGDGKENPYAVANSRMLTNINSISLSASYKLSNNIDFSKLSSNWESIGNGQSAFSGEFDGNNKIIKNVNQSVVNSTKENTYTGLFGNVDGAAIYKIFLTNINVSASTISGKQSDKYETHSIFGGALIGYAQNSKIENITITKSKINITGQNSVCGGGMIGYSDNCTVDNITISEDVTIITMNTFAFNDYIIDSENNKTVATTPNSVGWVGFGYKDISVQNNIYSAAGGLIGMMSGELIPTDCVVRSYTEAKVEEINLSGLKDNSKDVDIHEFLDYIKGIGGKEGSSKSSNTYLIISNDEGGKSRHSVAYFNNSSYNTITDFLVTTATYSLRPNDAYRLYLSECGLRREWYYWKASNEFYIADLKNWLGYYYIYDDYSCTYTIYNTTYTQTWEHDEENSMYVIRTNNTHFHMFKIYSYWLHIEKYEQQSVHIG
ncbi:MAG: hypothetical protein ACI4T2_01050 [Christensenellales bacterium]